MKDDRKLIERAHVIVVCGGSVFSFKRTHAEDGSTRYQFPSMLQTNDQGVINPTLDEKVLWNELVELGFSVTNIKPLDHETQYDYAFKDSKVGKQYNGYLEKWFVVQVSSKTIDGYLNRGREAGMLNWDTLKKLTYNFKHMPNHAYKSNALIAIEVYTDSLKEETF